MDLPLNGGKCTWCSNRNVPTFYRLDRFLVDEEVIHRFPLLIQKVWPSDFGSPSIVNRV